MTMQLTELVYVSDSLLGDDPTAVLEALSGILNAARSRNAMLEVTGLVLFDWTRFASVIEGPSHAAETIFASVRTDVRHTNVSVVRRRELQTRAFAPWPMACSVFDPNVGLEATITLTGPGLTAPTLNADALLRTRELADLLHEFAKRTDGGVANHDTISG